MTSVLTVVGTLFENIETKFEKVVTTKLISSTAAAALEVMHPYKDTAWESAIVEVKQITSQEASAPLNTEAAFVANLKRAQESAALAGSPHPIRSFFTGVALNAEGVFKTKDGAEITFSKTGSKYSGTFAWALFKYLRHADYGCIQPDCTYEQRLGSQEARSSAALYALYLASHVVTWDEANATVVYGYLKDSMVSGRTSPTYAKGVFDEAQQAQDLMQDVMKQQESGEDFKSKLAQAGLSASSMWSSLMVARLEKFSMLSFLIVVNLCFFLLVNKRSASLRKHRQIFAGLLAVAIAVVVVRAFLTLIRRTESFKEHWSPDSGDQTSWVEQERRGDLEDQIYTTQKLLNDINVDVKNRKEAFDRKRAAMEHTYASFRFSERHSNRHVGLMHLLTVLSFVIMIVVVLQKERVKMDSVMMMYAPVIVLGVFVATVMQRTDQARMRTNWDKIYFQRPE
jgi:hypothetical protein